jgi:hypothetical protein
VANYVKATNFAVKDSLTTGNPSKLVKGTEIDTEFNAISSAIATKFDINGGTLSLTTLTVSTQLTSAAQTIAGNVTITGNNRRIIAPMTSSTIAERTMFQTSVTNGVTIVGAIPNGNATESRVSIFNTTDTVNYSALDIRCTSTEAMVRSQADGTGSYLPLTFWNNISERMRITTSGEVMIAGNTDQGAYNLQVNGTGIWAAGAYVNGSDARIKTNVKDLPDSLELVNNIRPITFEYNKDIGYSSEEGVHTGFIAQELQQVLANTEYADTVVKEGGQYLSVAYQNLIPLLVKSIQELTKRVEELENK